MRIIKHMIAFSVIAMMAAAPALAVEDPAVAWMLESGISSGVAPGDYGEDLPVTWGQAIRLSTRALYPDKAQNVETHMWADRYEYHHRANDLVVWKDICNIAVAAGGPVAPRCQVGDAGWDIWQETGLIPDSAGMWDKASRGELADVLYAITTGNYDMPPCPTPVEREAGYLTYDFQTVPVIEAIRRIPDKVTEQFTEDGWTVVVGDDWIDKYKMDGLVIGVTSYGDKIIGTFGKGPIPHEFGHYVDKKLGFPQKHMELYRKEATALSNAVKRTYCTTNEMEYFAECFEWTLNGKYTEEFMRCAPQTYEYMTNLFEEIEAP